jgi:hypothetical protein
LCFIWLGFLTYRIELKRTPYVWKYFPDDFNEFRTFLSESELTNEKTKKWNSDYLELMEHRKNPNYGRNWLKEKLPGQGVQFVTYVI